MSASHGGSIPSTRLPLGGEPRVQLLPPSVRARERARASARLAVLLVTLGVVVAGALIALGFLRSLTASLALETANARTQELLAEKAQYVEATRVATTIAHVTETQQAVTSYEIDLAGLLDELGSRLGEGMSLNQVSVAVQPPWGVPLAVEDALAPPRIANLTLAVGSTTIEDATAYRDSLESLPGFASAVLTDTAVSADGAVVTHIKLALATGAVSGRFVPGLVDDSSTDADADESAEG